MPSLKALVEIEDIMEALDLVELPPGCRYKPTGACTLDVRVSQDAIDNKATEPDQEAEFLPIDERDLRDGLRAIIIGDMAMAHTLLSRAMDQSPEACRIFDEVLR